VFNAIPRLVVTGNRHTALPQR